MEKQYCYVHRVTELKQGKAWQVAADCTDVAETYKSLALDLMYSKWAKGPHIKSIRRNELYNGFVEIIVTYDGSGKEEMRNRYIVNAR